jgi:hypothetical protein
MVVSWGGILSVGRWIEKPQTEGRTGLDMRRCLLGRWVGERVAFLRVKLGRQHLCRSKTTEGCESKTTADQKRVFHEKTEILEMAAHWKILGNSKIHPLTRKHAEQIFDSHEHSYEW